MVVANLLSVIYVPFFIVHYGGFMAIHLFILIGLFGPTIRSDLTPFSPEILLLFWERNLLLALAMLFVSHGVSFAVNFFGKREFKRITIEKLMFAPYKRIIVMQFTIILGGWLALSFGEPLLALMLLIVFKTGVDISSHLREHRTLELKGEV